MAPKAPSSKERRRPLWQRIIFALLPCDENFELPPEYGARCELQLRPDPLPYRSTPAQVKKAKVPKPAPLEAALSVALHPTKCRCDVCASAMEVVPSGPAPSDLSLDGPLSAAPVTGSPIPDPDFRSAEIVTRVQERTAARRAFRKATVGEIFPRAAFTGSPQDAAILNIMLRRYITSFNRAAAQTPYAVRPDQLALLRMIGMEIPVDGSPSVPHGFHKNIEEMQLRLVGGMLQPNQYGLISVKASKVSLLPTPRHIQNPVMEGKDASRYPTSGLSESTFRHVDPASVFLLHDVSSVVGPHELVERLVAENPTAHLFVTGVNPPEVLTRATSFFPNSHRIFYTEERGVLHWLPDGSEEEGYEQPIDVTLAWLQTSSIRGSNGVVYQVVLLDSKFGHNIWHIFPADIETQKSRSFSTGNFRYIPARYSGDYKPAWLDRTLVTGLLNFGDRTTVRTMYNYAAKAAGIKSAANGAFISARDAHVAARLCTYVHPDRNWLDRIAHYSYLLACLVTLHWTPLLEDVPEVFQLIDERRTAYTIECTEGGGWHPVNNWKVTLRSIPNRPSALETLTAVTSFVYTGLLPKMLAGVGLVQFWHTDFLGAAQAVWHALDLSADRLALTGTVLAITAILPSRITNGLKHLALHFYRQIWIPGCFFRYFTTLIVELVGAPGYRILPGGPGRGWLWQLGLWLVLLHEIFPALLPGGIALTGVHGVFVVAFMYHPLMHLLWYAILVSPLLQWLWYLGPTTSPEPAYPIRPTGLDAKFISDVLFATEYARVAGIRAYRAFRNHLPRHGPTPDYRPNSALAPTVTVTAQTQNPQLPQTTVIIQPPVPANLPRGPTYIDPTGLSYRDWLVQVQDAYTRNQQRYPALDPNSSCFYDSVANLVGGTPHQWYSWYLAACGIAPGNATAPYGQTSTPGMIDFTAKSQFGYDIEGAVRISSPAQNGWPVLHLTLTRNNDGTLHCTPRTAVPLAPTVGHLATLLACVNAVSADWYRELQTRHLANPPTAQCVPTAFARGVCTVLDNTPIAHADADRKSVV